MPHHIVVDIKAIMRHILRCDQSAWAKASLLELLRLIQWDHLVAHAVDDQSSTGHLVHLAQVVELLCEKGG